MSTEIAVREPQSVALSNEQLRYIANTQFVPQGLRGNVPAIMACVATGRALGIDDMASLRLIHVVDGRPAFSAELMTQLVRKRGHSITFKYGEGSCTVTGRRADNGDEGEVTWTLEMAKRAGLAGKGNWQKYPEAMLFARAVSQLCRMLFADVFAGGTYTPEEIGGDDAPPAVDMETGEIIEGSVVQESGPGDVFGEEAWEKAANPPADDAPADAPKITAKQVTRLHTIASKNKVPDTEVDRIILAVAGVESSKDIPRDKYDDIISQVEGWKPAGLSRDEFVEAVHRIGATRELVALVVKNAADREDYDALLAEVTRRMGEPSAAESQGSFADMVPASARGDAA